jgi:hypothetical protein
MTIDILRPDQIEPAAKTLAEAFWDDPLMHIVAPNEKKRATVGPWFFVASERLMLCPAEAVDGPVRVETIRSGNKTCTLVLEAVQLLVSLLSATNPVSSAQASR